MNMKVKDAMRFYSTSQKYYYHTDKLIKRFRQEKGGYIIFAEKHNVSTDKAKGNPNQKWHFMTSYCEVKILENSSFLDEEMQQVYTRLKCPELLLWIIEATGLEVKSLFDEIWTILENGQNNAISRREACNKIKATFPWSIIEKKIDSLETK